MRETCACPDKSILLLKDLLAMRERFVKIERLLKVPLREKVSFLTKKYVSSLNSIQQKVVLELETSMATVEREIAKVISTDDDLHRNAGLITSVPGIGKIIAANLICTTRNFSSFKRGAELASYAGCVPFPHSSGSSVLKRAKVGNFANKKLKALIHLAALQNIRKGGELRKF